MAFYARFGVEIRHEASKDDLLNAKLWCEAVARSRDSAVKLWAGGKGDLLLPVTNQYCASCPVLLKCPASSLKSMEGPISDATAPGVAAAWLVGREQVRARQAALEAWCSVNGPIELSDGRSVGYAEAVRRRYTGADIREALTSAGLGTRSAAVEDGQYTESEAISAVKAITRPRSHPRHKALAALAELGTVETEYRFGVFRGGEL